MPRRRRSKRPRTNNTTKPEPMEEKERIKEAKEPTKERKIIVLILKENNNIRVLIID